MSDWHLIAIGVIFWFKRKGKYYLSNTAPKLPFESWGAFYVFDKRFDQLELRRKKPIKGKHFQWVTKEQIIKRLEEDDGPK